MSTASTPMQTMVAGSSRTTRQFGQAVALSLGLVVLGCVLYVVETFALGCRHRFIENPTEVMVRSFGLAHFLVGWLFLVSSSGMRTLAGFARLAGWSLVGGLLCLIYHAGGAGKNPWLVLGFYSLFLVHEVRDQAELFVARGDGPASLARAGLLRSLSACVILGLLALLVVGHLGQAVLRGSAASERVPAHVVLVGLLLLAVSSLLAGWRFLRLGRQAHGSVAALISTFEPLLGVYLALAGILTLGVALGSAAFNLIILIHVATWLITVRGKLGPTPAAWPGLWHWLRRTRTGFVALHLGLAAAILVLLALRVHLWQRAGVGSQLLSASSFPYWSLLHIAVALARRP